MKTVQTYQDNNSHVSIIISKTARLQKAYIPDIHFNNKDINFPHQHCLEMQLVHREERQAHLMCTVQATCVRPGWVSADWEKPETTVDSPRNEFWGRGL